MVKMRPTLRKVFGLSLLALLLGLALLFYLILDSSQKTIMDSARRNQDLASRDVAHRVTTYLSEAPMAVGHFEQQVKFGLIDPRKPDSIERGLLSLLLANDDISEATLTYANRKGVDGSGNLVIDQPTAGQVAVLRSKMEGEFVSRRTWFSGTQFISQSVTISRVASAPATSDSGIVPALDPTAHPTFQGAVSKDFYGQIISTDLHWSQIDEALPEAQRRVEVSVQKAIEDAAGQFAGVLRVGLMKTQVDRAVLQPITGGATNAPYMIFICDNAGRLITGFSDRDHVTVSGDDLRIEADAAPPAVAKALQEPILKDVGVNRTDALASFQLGNEAYLCTFLSLPDTQDWIVGVVVPRDFYLGGLLKTRERALAASLALMAIIIVTGTLIIRSVVRSHSLILRESARMKEFQFAPAHNSSYLQDIEEVLDGLEKAKTAMRAMSKYVPINLVRQLYNKGEEPVLGGESAELSVLFTDIKDFTAISENMTPDDLAKVLGRYLQVMAETIQSDKGTIDKYIGDAVMTFWNAPEPVPHHEILACRTALRCRAALQKLYDSPDWGKSPRFETRFGLHRCVASVGHFGAPDRLNYTAIGDGINLASRLEGLNKYYGTPIIASECIYDAAKDAFEFRLLDRVAVKGKTEGIVIYELLAERTAGTARSPVLDRYEQAFARYQRGDFTAALELIRNENEDAPSRVLAGRCQELLNHPPANWTGIYAFGSK
jgi:adenylate cyclase